MKIIVKESNQDRMQEELDKVQHCNCRRIITATDILQAIPRIEKHFQLIPKIHQTGITVTFSYHYDPSDWGYKKWGRPETTLVTFLRTATGWAVVDIQRGTLPKCECVCYLPQNARPYVYHDFTHF